MKQTSKVRYLSRNLPKAILVCELGWMVIYTGNPIDLVTEESEATKLAVSGGILEMLVEGTVILLAL